MNPIEELSEFEPQCLTLDFVQQAFDVQKSVHHFNFNTHSKAVCFSVAIWSSKMLWTWSRILNKKWFEVPTVSHPLHTSPWPLSCWGLKMTPCRLECLQVLGWQCWACLISKNDRPRAYHHVLNGLVRSNSTSHGSYRKRNGFHMRFGWNFGWRHLQIPLHENL